MSKIYDNLTPELLKEVQKIELEMLILIDKICKENDINYTLCGGTLLGAIRHKGFIPWDEDVDIDMLREDYEKFLKIAPKYVEEKYFLQNYKTDQYCLNIGFTKLRKNGTLLESEGQRHLDRHKGICIDIFPIDIVPENETYRKMQMKLLLIIQRIVAMKLKWNYYNDSKSKKIFKQSMSILLTPLSIKQLGYIREKISRMYEKTGSNLRTNTYSEIVYDKFTHRENMYKEKVLVEFENNFFYAPKKWDEYLTKLYGDYMKLPSIEERDSSQHNVIRISVGER